MLCTSRRGGSDSRISPSPSRPPGEVHLVARPDLPVGDDARAEVVLAADLGIRDRLPEALGRRADVDLEHLFHRSLQSLLDLAERCRPGLGVLAHPPVVDEPDRHGVQVVQLLAALPPCDDEPGLLEQLEVLHDAEAGHREPLHERTERLPVLAIERVEQLPASRVGQCAEHRVHVRTIGDHLVTCQGHQPPGEAAAASPRPGCSRSARSAERAPSCRGSPRAPRRRQH